MGPGAHRPRLLAALALAPLLLMLLLLLLAGAEGRGLPLHRRFSRQSVRLCSHSLSEALYMLCHERGYNEPFGSSSSEDGVPHTTGPGLVDECCYNACSIEQLEQYCKPKAPAD